MTVAIDPGRGASDDFPDLPAPTMSYASDGVKITISVDRAEFKPGSYDALITVSGPSSATVRVPVTVTIKSTFWLSPALLAFLGVVAGLFAAAYVAWSNQGEDETAGKNPLKGTLETLVSPYGVIAAVASLVLVYVVSKGPFREQYIGSDVWTNEFSNLMEIAAKSFATASGATVVAYFAKGFVKRKAAGARAAAAAASG